MAGQGLIDQHVRTHGNFKEFLEEKRCEACQSRIACKCLIQEGDDRCVACAGAGQQCVFRRSIIASGTPMSFKWTRLLEIDDMTLEEFTSNKMVESDSISLYGQGLTAGLVGGTHNQLQAYDIDHTQWTHPPTSKATHRPAPGLALRTDARNSSLGCVAPVDLLRRAFQLVIHLANDQNAQRVCYFDTSAEMNIISHQVVESLGLKKEEYQGAPLPSLGGFHQPGSQVTFDWHIARSSKTFTTTFAILDDRQSQDFDILLGRFTIQDIGLIRSHAPINPPVVMEEDSRSTNSKGSGQPVYQSNAQYPMLSYMNDPGPWLFPRRPFDHQYGIEDSLVQWGTEGSLLDLQNASGSPRKFENIFNTGMESALRRKRRTFNIAEKQRIKFARKHGACSECKLKKIKVVEPPHLYKFPYLEC